MRSSVHVRRRGSGGSTGSTGRGNSCTGSVCRVRCVARLDESTRTSATVTAALVHGCVARAAGDSARGGTCRGRCSTLAGPVAALRLCELVVHFDDAAHQRVDHLLLVVVPMLVLGNVGAGGSIQAAHVGLQVLEHEHTTEVSCEYSASKKKILYLIDSKASDLDPVISTESFESLQRAQCRVSGLQGGSQGLHKVPVTLAALGALRR